MRDILVAEGHMIPPPLGRRATGGDTSVRGLVRDFESENPTTSKPLPWAEAYEHPKKSLAIPGIVRGSGNYVRDGGKLATSHQKSISTPRHRRDRALNSHLQMKSPVVERVKRVIAKRRASRAIVKYDRGSESDFEPTMEGSNGNGKKIQSRWRSSEAGSGGESEKDNPSQGHMKMVILRLDPDVLPGFPSDVVQQGDISLLDGSSIIDDAASSVANDQAGVDLFQKLDSVPDGYENIEDGDVEEDDAATFEDEGGASTGDGQLQLTHNSQGQRNRVLLDLSLSSSPRTPNAGAADVNRLSTLVQREANNQSLMQLFDFPGMGGDPRLYNNMMTSPYWVSPGMNGLPIHHPYGNSGNYGGYSDYGIGFAGTHSTNGGNFFENRRNNIFTSNLLGVADEFPSNRTQFPAPDTSSIGYSNQNIAGGVRYSNVGNFADMGSQHLNE
ncbi:hypothetical protein B0O99DRAFT_209644 [Bisporella sp. PMI_857]|nr:hypothetical protein B0O99DRAFT_209644 [Bisporella sp. PMI_857]